MDGVAKKFVFMAFILGNLWEYTEGYSLITKHYRKYDNTSLVRFRRQATEESCKGDNSEFVCATTSHCIDIDLQCDGREDCPDGSDERDSLCKHFPKNCKTPAQPEHGEWIYLHNHLVGQPSVLVASGTTITFTCKEHYKLSSTNENSHPIVCMEDGTWSITVIPTCLKLCPNVDNSPILTVTCKTDGLVVPCDRATDFTVLTYQCAPYYEPPYARPEKSICFNGVWDYIPECITVCGEKRASASPLVVNGHIVERGQYPWVVALYSSRDLHTGYMNICGGSLISTKIVLTAAHCVTKETTGKLFPIRYFRIAAGKYYNEYEDKRDNDTAQYSEILEIILHRDYRGELQNFRGDIAVLKLKTPLKLSKVVQPVCYNNLPAIRSNDIGLVTGWGYTTTTGQPSEKLKGLELPYTDDIDCAGQLDPEFSECFFISDKMCAGFYNQNTSVCKGDSGGGLVFKNPQYKNRYFLHGIVSLGHIYREDEEIHCNVQRSALFTRVQTYLEWIQLTARRLNAEIPLPKQIHSKRCITPEQPENGKWVYLNNNKIGEAHSRVEIQTVLVFTCKKNYKLSSTNENSHSMVCMPDGSWSTTEIPTCQKLCPKVSNSPTLTVTCKKDGAVIPCDRATDFTLMPYKCEPYYDISYGKQGISRCYNGTWDYTPDCIQVCGEKRVNGKEVEGGHYPWVVSLYSMKDSDQRFTNICSGTMITTNHILTAAHCVTNTENGKSYPAKYYQIAAGKNIEYNDPRDNNTAQYSEVEEIFVHQSYLGEVQNFRGDIAILKLKTTLALSEIVQPVCFYNLPTLEPNVKGLVTGWGYPTEIGYPTESPKEVDLTYISSEKCIDLLNKDFGDRYFVSDKMCLAEANNNISVCKESSGGGLVVKNPHYKNRYFIHGIINLEQWYGENKHIRCNVQKSAVFTRVEDYLEWIQSIVRRLNVEITTTPKQIHRYPVYPLYPTGQSIDRRLNVEITTTPKQIHRYPVYPLYPTGL